MIPIPIEPERLVFDPQSHGDDCLLRFRDFTTCLDDLFSSLRRHSLRIAVTKELYTLLAATVPIVVYEPASSLHKIARELYGIRFLKAAKVVHSYGEHDLVLEFDSTCIQNLHLFDKDIYQHWLDLLGLGFQDEIIRIILRNQTLSIFSDSHACLKNQHNHRCDFEIALNVDTVIDSSLYSFKRLQLMATANRKNGCTSRNCSGTGDHSSMWGPSIQKLGDVPLPERALLQCVLDSGLAKRIVLLSFDKRAEVADTPHLKINSSSSGECSDVVHATLHGRGCKQNCQDLAIHVEKGTGNLFAKAFPNGITLESLNVLIGQ
jgi:hypothetical protein